ncbi:substrate-binding periplasmic protein [Desulfosarcina ovata]|uniref:ABC transporter substrate-binding protein n=1 Tax=Desulfosarcina ovata subsp. ovata TaxID=2752305 RepID=A0A5K8A4F6_9BACT|nr:transporter substrate-binding domain-containing protein [Desulfosarcina ovata]BBO87425.1 ABC transporter substrate-binding protein [Desulfosarcina ovata subsp. ovata]
MKLLVRIVLFFSIFSIFSNLAAAHDITVLTTIWAPYAYEENGKLTGLSTEIVTAVLDRAGLSAKFYLYPWKRAIVTAADQKDVLIYPLMRIKERENNFIWVAPVFNAEISLYKLKKRTDITITSLDDARKYTIGVLRGAAMHQHLLSHGFVDNQQLRIFGSNRKSVELLFKERIDLIADNPMVVSYEAQKVGFSMTETQKVLHLFENEAYMAFGKGSSEKYVERLKKALEHLRSEGTIETICEKYR